MTLIAGFPYNNGILLCSETEHSNDQVKTHSRKLFDCTFDVGSAVFGYTGTLAIGLWQEL